MKLKRILVSMMAVAMTVSIVPTLVFADKIENDADETAIIEVADTKAENPAKFKSGSMIPTSGTCGKNLKWNVDGNGSLVISGSGAMNSYKAGGAPWYALKDKITSLAFSGSPTSIGNYAFYNLDITSVYIRATIKTVGTGAFYNCKSLTKVTGGNALTSIGTAAFKQCSSLSSFTINSKKLSKIGSNAFSGASSLKKINIAKTTKLTKKGVKKSLANSSVTTVNVKNNKKVVYKYYFSKSNSGKKVSVK
ncbi:MAG: leucine-rich repeat domain-containing protein [Ruminococcaceae bacterium]|nr:leucine-rich repeat domain-containing protein [Oscillospiraceae bacterium]